MTLQEKIKESKYTNTELAYKLGISEMSLYRKLTGKSRIRRGEMTILSLMLNLTDEEQAKIVEELNVQP